MQAPKHIQFTNLIKAGGQLHEFNFRRSLGPEGPLFTVDVADKTGERHYLLFRLEVDRWVLKTKAVPGWIAESIQEVQQAIDAQV